MQEAAGPGSTGAGQWPGQGSVSRQCHCPGSRAGAAAAAGTGGAGQLEPGRHHQAAAAPAQCHLPAKQTGLFLAGSEGGRVAGRVPGPGLSCPITPAEAQQRWREPTAPERSGEQCPGVPGGKLHSPCKCPSVDLEESKEGGPVFSSMHGRTGEAETGRRGSVSIMPAF